MEEGAKQGGRREVGERSDLGEELCGGVCAALGGKCWLSGRKRRDEEPHVWAITGSCGEVLPAGSLGGDKAMGAAGYPVE
ncbi:hypothetical protein [Bartonella sp. TT110JLCBS]|uniref:hypothetical protein n=1 Tax=Bartonella sp. TT110JLCBS TaxID=3243578 RepID=UPI0035CF5B0C